MFHQFRLRDEGIEGWDNLEDYMCEKLCMICKYTFSLECQTDKYDQYLKLKECLD